MGLGYLPGATPTVESASLWLKIRNLLDAALIEVIDYRCDDRRFWLSAHNCQVPTPTSQNLDLEQKIRIFEAD